MLSTILLTILIATGIITAGLFLLIISVNAGLWFPVLLTLATLCAIIAPIQG